MGKRIFFTMKTKKIMQIGLSGAGALCILLSFIASPGLYARSRTSAGARGENHLEILKKIFDEVKEFDYYPGTDFIKGEFFLGLDDDDTNKDEHIVVLIQNVDGMEKMKIQVTSMETKSINPKVQIARDTKNIVCLIAESKISIQRSDYDEKELKKLAPEILRSIQDKKKLLKGLCPNMSSHL